MYDKKVGKKNQKTDSRKKLRLQEQIWWSDLNIQNSNFIAPERDWAALSHLSWNTVYLLYQEPPPLQIWTKKLKKWKILVLLI